MKDCDLEKVNLNIHVKPFSSKNSIKEVKDDKTIIISINAKPKNNEANDKLIDFLSEIFEITRSKITITSGHKNRNKVVSIIETSCQEIEEKILQHVRKEEK